VLENTASKREEIPAFETIVSYLEHFAKTKPDADAAIQEGATLSYAELYEKVLQCGNALKAFGIRPGDRIATLAPPSLDFWITFLGTLSVGAIWIGLNPRYQKGEMAYVLNDAKPRLLFARAQIDGRDYGPMIEELQNEIGCIEKIVALDGTQDALAQFSAMEQEESNFAGLWPDANGDQGAFIVYTSGSTGKPKGALLTHRGMILSSRTTLAIWQFSSLRVLNNLPINHVGCVGDISCFALIGGGAIAFAERYDPEGSLKLIQNERLTMWGQVPTMFQMSLATGAVPRYDLSSLELITWEGSAAPVDLVRSLLEICPTLATAYGLTETIGCVTFTPPTNDVDLLASSAGFPVPDYDFRIADENGGVVAKGEEGEIQVRGEFVMSCYWNNPEATARTKTSDGWFRTGDIGMERQDGAISIVGRLSDMYKSGGYNVYPREVESVLESCPGVAMAAVIGVPDPLYDEVGHAYLLTTSDVPPSEADIDAICRAQLSNYKVPKAYFVLRDLPMLPIGKIDKKQLKADAIQKRSQQ
jgi:acyl-CoA synthetase (AMP-forming)/AMP-acid ligase II